MNEDQMRAWIDEASYEDLLRKWRFASTGDPFFERKTGMGEYYEGAMSQKRAEIGNEAAARISRIIGWNK